MWSYWAVFVQLPSGDAVSKVVSWPFVQQREADLGRNQWISINAGPLAHNTVKRRELWTNLVLQNSWNHSSSWAEAITVLWRFSRFLSGLPCPELYPCRVSSLQPGVGDGAAGGEHQDLSPVLPSTCWAGLSHARGCAWCFLDAFDTVCAARWSSSSYVCSSWIYLLQQWVNKPQVDPSDHKRIPTQFVPCKLSACLSLRESFSTCKISGSQILSTILLAFLKP